MLFESQSGFIFYDGAMGTMLQNCGSKPCERPDKLCITNPQAVENVHRMYVEAGSDIICTNTFGCNAEALAETGYKPEEVITAAVTLAKRACGATTQVALDIGPIGMLIEPLGELGYDRAYEMFMEQALAGERAGADYAAIETMSDLTEVRAAMLAVTENTSLPVLVTMTFDNKGRTYLGCAAEEFAETAERLGASAVGINCSFEPGEMYETAARIAKTTALPLILKLNAGLPDPVTGEYNIGPAEYARQMSRFAGLGVRIVGGCCGTTPDHIREMKKTFLKM